MKIKLGDFKVSFNFKTFHFYSDSGHGWCKVPYECLYRLGILDKISEYSYWGKHQNYVFLEEDMDYGTFVRAYREETGKEPKIIYHNTDKYSKIRSYPSYFFTKTDKGCLPY